ncbi:formylmethanofuran dehydrogenase subunit B [Bythopirellula polymerisocia]|uniref:Formyltransferase/hydrolase complex Fhc subunit B n=1 Tax=Bythopirellula polymerisocia TaxID=2528003 RepID=A0A5C6CXZ3_9BACT|nr:formylmethanofuran dehydrogenase subunit B [Bythopirellula polymerisocia]TWU27856.1 Formyltransferase/hydrolase complex Fhc subunit B [Bythopirellula polymerisocia]
MAKKFDNVTCIACGCLCDDLVLHVADDKIIEAERACSLSEPLFRGIPKKESGVPEIEGEEVSLEAAIERASEILGSSSAPLIWGLADSTIQAQRSAINLADRLGATLDPALSPFHRDALVALQSVGISTCTLGEVKQRADLIVFWGCDPVTTHPRFFERFIDPPGRFVRGNRKVIVVSGEQNATAEIANEFLQVQPGCDFDVLSALRALVQEVAIEGKSFGGISLDQLQKLAVQLQSANYCVICFGPEVTSHGSTIAMLESLFLLARSLNGNSRCSAIGLGGPIAENVLTWQTGYPCGVNFASGYPRYDAEGYSANRLLKNCEVDAVLMVGTVGLKYLSKSARYRLGELPVVLLESIQRVSSDETRLSPTVQIPISQSGMHTGGTVFRMDGVPLPLRPVIDSQLPSEESILAAIMEGVLAQCSC